MSWQYVGTNKVTGNTGTLTLSLTALTGGIDTAAREGDLVLAAYAAVSTSNLSLTVGDGTWDSPTGLWANDTRDANLRIATKVMTATPDTQVQGSGQTTATNGAVMVCHVWRGVDVTTPLDVAVVGVTGTNSALPNPDPITPVTANAMLIAVGAGTGTAVNNAVTAPSGYTNLAQVTIDPGNSITCAIASKAWGGAGAEDPAAFGGLTTTTSDGWAAFTLAIRPAAATVATVTTQAASSVGTTTATGNGNITDTGGANPDTRGIVYSTTTHGAPGNVAPGSSGYESVVNETGGSFGTGAFTEALTGLASNTAYFARAYTHNSVGYSYGDEVSFTTVATFNDRRQAIIDHIVSAQSETNGWNAKRSSIPVTAVVRTSSTVVTITLPAIAGYDITADEHLTVTVPGEVLAGATDIVATPTVDIVPASAGFTLTAQPGAVAITGSNAGVNRGYNVTAQASALAITGSNAGVNRGYNVTAQAGVVSIGGTLASLLYNRLVAAQSGAAPITGVSASLNLARMIGAQIGTVDILGVSANLFVGTPSPVLIAQPGAVSITGTNVGLLFSRLLGAQVGIIAIAGVNADFLRKYTVTAQSGTVAIVGIAAGVLQNRNLTAQFGVVPLTGVNASFSSTYKLTAQPGIVLITGMDADVRKSGYSVTAIEGAVPITSVDAFLLYHRVFMLLSGTVDILGNNTTVKFNRLLSASVGAVGVVGTNANLRAGKSLVANAVAIAIAAGPNSFLLKTVYLGAESGIIPIIGTDVNLISVEPGRFSTDIILVPLDELHHHIGA